MESLTSEVFGYGRNVIKPIKSETINPPNSSTARRSYKLYVCNEIADDIRQARAHETSERRN